MNLHSFKSITLRQDPQTYPKTSSSNLDHCKFELLRYKLRYYVFIYSFMYIFTVVDFIFILSRFILEVFASPRRQEAALGNGRSWQHHRVIFTSTEMSPGVGIFHSYLTYIMLERVNIYS